MFRYMLLVVWCSLLTLSPTFSVLARSISPTLYDFPATIAGLELKAVLNSSNTACLSENEIRLVVSTDIYNVEEFLYSKKIAELTDAMHDLSRRYGGIVTVGVVSQNGNLEDAYRNLSDWNTSIGKNECPKYRGIDQEAITTGAPGSPGYITLENLSAGQYTDDNAQSVYFVSPTNITYVNQPYVVAFLNNVVTDAFGFYMLQVGFSFSGPTNAGSIIYTSTSYNYGGRIFPFINYYNNRHYWFSITYTSGLWWVCGKDMTTNTYHCEPDPGGQGTTIIPDINTGIFVENQNLTSPIGYSSLRAYGAKIYRNGFGQAWSQAHRHTFQSQTCAPPPPDIAFMAIQGNLVMGQSASFITYMAPPLC